MIKITKWKYNANSPVMFMIDDIANIYIKKGSSSNLEIGEDWGHFGSEKNSMWDFLNRNLYSLFPDIKTTFFLVTDKRTPENFNMDYTYAEAIDKDKSFIEFLKMLHNHTKVELAYHGTTHGKVGPINLKQEWDTYESLDQAIETIEYGKELYKKVLGKYPQGGKYCGYSKGKYGDTSINRTDFLWWCRDADIDLEKDQTIEYLSYDLEYFNNTIDMPTTIDGSFLSVKRPQASRKYLVTLYKKLFQNQSLEKSIMSLYKNKQVISIQEHSSPYRTDDKIQYPNIVSDIKNLQYIFKKLSELDVWYGTGTEIAEYFSVLTNVKIKRDKNSFMFLFNDNFSIREGIEVTILVEKDNYKEDIKIEVENKIYTSYKKNNSILVDIPVYKNKIYKLIMV